MRKLVFTFLLTCITAMFAQLPTKGDWTTRLGCNPTKAAELYASIFQSKHSPVMPANESKPVSMDFYRNFKQLVDMAPYCSYYLYNGYLFEGKGGKKSVFERMLDGSKDAAIRKIIVDDILAFGRHFVDDLDSVNVVRNNRDTTTKAAHDTLSLPIAMTKYAHLYYQYGSNPRYYPQDLYNKVQARENYASAFRMLRERNIDPGNELEGFYVNEYYKTCEQLFKSDEDKYYEQFLTDYLDIVKTCDNLLIPYYDVPDSIKNGKNPAYRQFQSYNYYTNHPIEGVKALFKASGAATPERLNKYYRDQLKSHRRDNDYLGRAINLLLENGCANTEAFFEYCEASYAIKPTYLNCFGSALASKKYNMRDEMIKYFQEAYELAENDLQRGTMAYQIGMALNTVRPMDPATNKNYPVTSPEYAEWETNMFTASSNLMRVINMQEAFKNSPSIDIRKYPADAYYALALNIYRMVNSSKSVEECDRAISYLQAAKQAAPDKYNTNADDQINKISRTRDQLAALNREQKAYEKRKKEYEAYLKKKKAEEDFWNQQ